MNRLFFLLFFIFTYGCTHAQNIACQYIATTIISEDVKNIEDINIRNAVIDKLSNRKQLFSLKFSAGKYLFESIENTEKEDNVMSIGGSSIIYMDMNKNISISQENILDRTFLIQETMKKYTWDITNETNNILGKKCTKAVLKDKPSIVAWFTAEIPISFGPMGYYGLPGLILQLETETNKYILQELSLPKNQLLIKEPNKGKTISRADFEALKKKKQESLGIGNGNDGKVKIIKM